MQLKPIVIGNQSFYYLKTAEEVAAYAATITENDRLASDTETCIHPDWNGKGGSPLDPHTAKVALWILCKEDDLPAVVDTFLLTQEEIEPLLDKVKKVKYSIFHNAKFDWQMLVSNYGLNLRRVHCTMIMSQLLANATGSKHGRVRGHGYADVCRDLLDIHIEGKKDLRATVWSIAPEARTVENEWWLAKLVYAATDVVHLFEIHDMLEAVLTNPLPKSKLHPDGAEPGDPIGVDMRECLEMEWRFTPINAKIEYTGVPVDLQLLNSIANEIQRELEESAVRLCKHFNLETVPGDIWTGKEVATEKSMRVLRSPERMRTLIGEATHMGKLDTTEGHFLERLMDIIDQLSAGSKEEDTDSATKPVVDFTSAEERDTFAELLELEESTLQHSNAVVRDVLTFKRMVKQVGMDLRKFINPRTGRLHFKLHQLGTATGRTCIVGDMKVHTTRGKKPIREVKVGEEVFCWNGKDVVARKVTNWWHKGETETVSLVWRSGIGRLGFIMCTPCHRFLTKNNQWVRADELLGKEIVYLPEIDKSGREIISVMPHGVETVYDIEVEEYNNFFCEELCVHNSSSGPNVQQIPARLYVKAEAELSSLFSTLSSSDHLTLI